MKTEDIDTEFSKIKQTPFYKEFGAPLYHASQNNIQGILKITRREEPRDTATPFHNEVNALSREKHGIEVRNTLFVAKTPVNAYSYAPSGSVYSVSPLSEDYQVWYSTNTEDMTNDLRVTGSAMAMNLKARLVFDTIEVLKHDEDFDHTQDNLSVKRIANIVLDYFKEAIYNNKTYRISDCYMEVYRKLDANKQVRERFKNPMLKIILKQKTWYENLAYEYVLTLKRLESSDDLNNINDRQELMLFDPQGVYAVRYAQG